MIILRRPIEPVDANLEYAMSARENAHDPAVTIVKSDVEWRRRLTREQYRVTREGDTERAFTGPCREEKRPKSHRAFR